MLLTLPDLLSSKLLRQIIKGQRPSQAGEEYFTGQPEGAFLQSWTEGI